ncbi:MAG TPA: NAD(P)-dependent oxidoreductase [Acidimicrobiales bacterium]|nr:NAD(P)-dependent oxidoreductase [Acidimicrobiales bacterium]
MLTGEKILITGPAGQIAQPMAASLARDNEVWGIARFADPATRERVAALGVKTVACDLGDGDFTGVPDDFSYVLHLAALQGPGLDYDGAIRANAEGTGLLLAHCRRAKAVLVMSTHSVYKPQEDSRHLFVETDPLGDSNPAHAPTYSVSKQGQEAVARTCSRLFDLPVVIARMNASYGPNGGLPANHLNMIMNDQPVVTRWDPCPYSPIYEDDINEQVEGVLAAASVPATILNWAGDEAVTVQEWCEELGRLVDRKVEVIVRETPGTLRGSIADVSRRQSFTGPCKVGWKEGMRRMVEARVG